MDTKTFEINPNIEMKKFAFRTAMALSWPAISIYRKTILRRRIPQLLWPELSGR